MLGLRVKSKGTRQLPETLDDQVPVSLPKIPIKSYKYCIYKTIYIYIYFSCSSADSNDLPIHSVSGAGRGRQAVQRSAGKSVHG